MKRNRTAEEQIWCDVVCDDVYAALKEEVRTQCVEAMRERVAGEEAVLADMGERRTSFVEHRTSNVQRPTCTAGDAAAEARRPPGALEDGFREAVRQRCLAAVREHTRQANTMEGGGPPPPRMERPGLPLFRRRAWSTGVLAAAAALAVAAGVWVLIRTEGSAPVETVERLADPLPPPAAEGPAPAVETVETAALPADPERPDYVVVTPPLPPGVLVRTADDPPEIEYLDDDELLAAVPGIAIARVGDVDSPSKIIVRGPGIGTIVRVR